ncbi:putative type IX sorting system protein PorV2 [Hymenobacter guriensis]|uniref:PorV/PorQ family protein n=1 Tax=Hymenobacter guriensis TaxID=2793065 RepID=A0ABS0KVS3_9BACT|nr:PorV/PorQ family protein [Hymenobacter guriensis]MBG8551952.1 PorV/PorQ family protein [Hymenobacter guriensis]
MMHLFRFARVLGVVGLSVTLTTAALAQSTDNTPKYANEFLNIGVGARALGMGNTQVSLAQDATAGYWNPAGLLGQKTKYDAVLMHSELFSGIVKNDYAAFSMPLDERSAIGASIIRLGVDDIADTRNLVNEYGQINYDNITYFSVADYAMLLSYARKLGPEGLTVGANGKIVYRNVGSFATAWGFGFDAGAQYQHGNLRLGLMARDITTTITAWSINSEKFRNSNDTLAIPKSSSEITLPRVVLGAAYNVKLPGQFSALVSTDLETTTDGRRNTPISTSFISIDPKLGLEVAYHSVAFLRAGVSNFQKIEGTASTKESWRAQPSLGVGFTTSGLRLDVALSRLAVEQAKTNSIIVSLGYGFH